MLSLEARGICKGQLVMLYTGRLIGLMLVLSLHRSIITKNPHTVIIHNALRQFYISARGLFYLL
jgi:hypothetical protein